MRLGRLALAAALAVSVLAVDATSSAQAATWTVVHLEPLPGDVSTDVFDVNAAGIAVGSSSANPLESTPVVWDANGNPTALSEPPESIRGQATAISDDGAIVGHTTSADVVGLGATSAWRWLPGPTGYTRNPLGAGAPSDVNRHSVNTVGADPAPPVSAAAIWVSGMPPAFHPPTETVGQSGAVRVSDAGVVVGYDGTTPVAWFLGNRHELYPGLSEGFGGIPVEVKDVINAFYTLGWITVGDRVLSFVQAPGGAIYPLAPDSYESGAVDLNNYGIGAGYAADSGGPSYAAVFVYGTTRPIRSLLSTGEQGVWTSMTIAKSLSDAVHVVGNGTRAGTSGQQSWLVRPPA